MTPSSRPFGAPARPEAGGGLLVVAGRLALLALAVVAGGCATGGTGGPSPEPAPDDRPAKPPAAEARDDGDLALDEVDRLMAGGRLRAAAVLADSLYFRTRSRSELSGTAAAALSREARALERNGELAAAADRLRELLRRYPDRAGEDAPLRLARLSISRADDPAAAAALLRWPGAGGAPALSLVRRAARSMSVAELRAVLGGGDAGAGPGDGARQTVRAALRAELAVALARAGQAREARDEARGVLEGAPRDADAARARSVLDGAVPPRRGPVRIALLVPRSGRFASVGDRLLEGAELAVETHGGGGPAVELVTGDTGPDEAGVAGLVRRVQQEEDLVAVVGPVQTDGLARAARARADSGLLLVSPTASRAPEAGPAVYTLWERSRREIDAARRLGRWMAGVLGGVPVGVVYPSGATGRRAYLEFRRAIGRGRAWIAAAAAYDPGATTLEGPITAVSAFGPRAVFAPGGGGSSVLQMAPQLSYYGVRGALVAGGPGWSRPSTVRRLEPSFSQHRILAAFVDRDDRDSPWSRFRALYEKTYDKSMGGNVLPALGHDAVLLALQALRDVRPVRPRAVARRAAALESVAGATGRFRLDPADGTAARQVLIRSLRERALAPASPREARSWLESAGRFETARLRSRRERALRAVRESGIPLTRDGGR